MVVVGLREGEEGGREGWVGGGSEGNGGGDDETGVAGSDSFSRNWTNRDDRVGCVFEKLTLLTSGKKMNVELVLYLSGGCGNCRPPPETGHPSFVSH